MTDVTGEYECQNLRAETVCAGAGIAPASTQSSSRDVGEMALKIELRHVRSDPATAADLTYAELEQERDRLAGELYEAQVALDDLRATCLVALSNAPKTCPYHGTDFALSGYDHGEPRCESCRQPFRVARALHALEGTTT